MGSLDDSSLSEKDITSLSVIDRFVTKHCLIPLNRFIQMDSTWFGYFRIDNPQNAKLKHLLLKVLFARHVMSHHSL